MAKAEQNRALKMRIETLGLRIATLKEMMHDASDARRIGKLGELYALEKRHDDLAHALEETRHEGSGFREAWSANLSLLADTIQGGLDSLIVSIDAHSAADEDREVSGKP
jgi:predicted  nucleic acid-binding Zn-ribbon protein